MILSKKKEGVIILIPKVKNINTVGGFRFISLLNCKTFYENIGEQNPNCTSRPDWCGAECLHICNVENLIKLRNLIAASSVSYRIKFAVSQEYLWRCLEKLNFPEQFIRFIRRLYCDASSRIPGK
jgi:hypothetical protein